MKISLIAAVSRSGVIGKDNKMPWHLPADLKYFKSITMGKPIVMGRKTFESLGRPLPGRDNIVMTENRNFSADGVKVIHSIDDLSSLTEAEEVMVIGGAQIYTTFLPVASRMFLTQVNCQVEGDTWFPDFDPADWEITMLESHKADENNTCDYTFLRYDRRH